MKYGIPFLLFYFNFILFIRHKDTPEDTYSNTFVNLDVH